MVKPHLIIANKTIALTQEGFLVNPLDWNEMVAKALAAQQDFNLTAAHWELINLLRNYYLERQIIPPLRVFSKIIQAQLGREKASSLYVHQLFPDTPLKTIAKFAGLPKPRHCM